MSGEIKHQDMTNYAKNYSPYLQGWVFKFETNVVKAYYEEEFTDFLIDSESRYIAANNLETLIKIIVINKGEPEKIFKLRQHY